MGRKGDGEKGERKKGETRINRGISLSVAPRLPVSLSLELSCALPRIKIFAQPVTDEVEGKYGECDSDAWKDQGVRSCL